MGANEKYEAAMHGYVPDVQIVRRAYAQAGKSFSNEEARADTFDRWLTQIRAEAKAEALDSLAQELVDVDMAGADEPIRAYDAAVWIRERANQYKEQS